VDSKIKTLLDELAGIVAKMQAIGETEEPLSEEAASELKSLEEQGDSLRSKIELYERAATKEAELRAVIERAAPKKVVAPEETAVATIEERSAMPIERRSEIRPAPSSMRPLRAFKTEEEAYRSGMWLRGYLLGDSYARRWCVEHGVETRAGGTPAQFGREGGVDSHSPSLGGATVNDEMARAIIRNMIEYSAVKYARNVTMNSDVLVLPKLTKGFEVTAVGENVAAPEKTLEFGNVKLIAGHWAVMNRIPNSLLEDSVIDLAEVVVDEMAQAYAQKYEELLFNADGTAAYHNQKGLINELTTGAHAASLSKAAATRDTPAELQMGDFTAAMAMLPSWAMRNAAWYMSPAVFGLAVVPIAMGVGGNTKDDVAAGPNAARFLGYPVHLVHSMYSSPASGPDKAFALFGDLSLAMAFGQRRQVTIKTSEDRFIEYDQLATVGFSRAGVAALDLGSDTQAGPIIAITGGKVTA
jgi:HK97 family phage major capsid protein